MPPVAVSFVACRRRDPFPDSQAALLALGDRQLAFSLTPRRLRPHLWPCLQVIPADTDVKPADILELSLAELRRDLRAMKLYDNSELVIAMHKQLQANGLTQGPIKYTDLLPFDQHHYHGSKAVQKVAEQVAIKNDSRVVNIGSGLGGPARFLAGTTGCQVLACEIQDDLHRTAQELTSRCDLSSQVHHVAGDFLQMAQHLQRGAYSHVVSWLTVLHIADRVELFKRCYSLLRPGGCFFAADFVQEGTLSHEEWKVLYDKVGCPSLAASPEVYANELKLAGFQVEVVESVTADWKAYATSRSTSWTEDRDTLTALYGGETYEQLLAFYQTVTDLFHGGNLGGLRVVARKPLGW